MPESTIPHERFALQEHQDQEARSKLVLLDHRSGRRLSYLDYDSPWVYAAVGIATFALLWLS